MTWQIARDDVTPGRHPPIAANSRHHSCRQYSLAPDSQRINSFDAAHLQASQGLDEVVDLVLIWSVNISAQAVQPIAKLSGATR